RAGSRCTRCQATSATASTARATCTSCATACGCSGRFCASGAASPLRPGPSRPPPPPRTGVSRNRARTPEGIAVNTSVVICVYTEERWEDIRQAVESVERQTRPPHELILVVDHNPDLHLKLKRAYPDAIVVANSHEQGLSGGKNTGVAAANGEIVAFLDDDAVADPGWLEALEEGFQDPGVVGVGGRTDPIWASGRRPRWFPHEFDWTVGCTYRGMPEVKAPIRNV